MLCVVPLMAVMVVSIKAQPLFELTLIKFEVVVPTALNFLQVELLCVAPVIVFLEFHSTITRIIDLIFITASILMALAGVVDRSEYFYPIV